MTKTIDAGLFDFSNTEGVPAEIAEAVNRERRSGLNSDLYEAVVAVVSQAPKALTIKQVIFVLHKVLAEVPTENTIRAYLNRARENGDIGKPSRQFYWTVETDVPDAEASDGTPASAEPAAEAVADPVEAAGDEDFDPLA